MKQMKRVYVAGKYNDSDVIKILSNMRLGMRTCVEVFKRGFAPFCPWLDYQFSLMLREGENLTVEDYYAYSMAWLEASDCVLMLPNWEDSKGAIAEKKRADELYIPVYYDMDYMVTDMGRKYGLRAHKESTAI
jgi:hypothetical protein